ncbi:MAG TPA: biopolymer transporter ExbD [Planctomycetaceae bacterium]|nr:biopolymer transporter ExbD [Planctomycetaceae bacterium]
MKFRGSTANEKIEAQMAPMIDVVFQLLIFFMLTLKIIEPEGDFSVNMPIGQSAKETDSITPQVIKIRLEANPSNGELSSLKILRTELFLPARGETQEEKSANAFAALNDEILRAIGTPGSQLAQEQEVELDPDFELNAKYLINAIGACRGRVQRNPDGTSKMIDYVKNIKFAPPRAKPE